MSPSRQRRIVQSLDRGPVEMKIRGCSQAARKERKSRHNNCRGVKTGHSSKGRVRNKGISTREGQTRGGHHAADPEMKRIQCFRADRVGLIDRENLPTRVVARSFVVEFIGLPNASSIKHVRASDRIGL